MGYVVGIDTFELVETNIPNEYMLCVLCKLASHVTIQPEIIESNVEPREYSAKIQVKCRWFVTR